MMFFIAAVAFAIEAAIGFGSTVFAVAVGATFVPIAVLVPAFVPVNLVLSATLALRGRPAWRVLALEIAPPVAAGMAVGLALPGARLAPVFACFATALALLQLARPHRLPRSARIAFLALGGVAHGLFGTGGPLVVYALRGRLDRAQFRATLAVLWLALNLALAASFTYTAEIAHTSALIALALPFGFVAGDRLHRRLPERVVWIVLALAGVALLIR